MEQESQLRTTFAPSDLKLYVYGTRQMDQFWLPSKSYTRKPFCLTDVEKFTFNSSEDDQHSEEDDEKLAVPNPLFNQTVYRVACGGLHSIVLTTDGRVFTFGCNDEGALGRKGTECIPIMVAMEDPIDLIAAGDNHSLFANSLNGAIYFTGNYNYKRGEKMKETSAMEPIRIYAHQVNIHNKNKRIEKLSCGANHSTFLINGKIFCRGEPEASTTGRRVSKRRTVENSLTFNGVNIANVVDVECGGYHTVVKTNRNGKIQYFSWGTNNHGQLGIGSFESQSYPTQIKKLRNKNVCQIAAGASFTLFLTAEGELFGCGSNEDSNLGLGEDFEYNESEEDSENENQQSNQCKPQIKQNSNPQQSNSNNAEKTVEEKQKEQRKNSEKQSSVQQSQPNTAEKMDEQKNKEKEKTMKPQQVNQINHVEKAVPSNQINEQINVQPKQLNSPQKEMCEQEKAKTKDLSKSYLKSVVKIALPQNATNIAAGENFGFAWNKQSLYSWGMGNGYVLLNGEENDESTPFKVKSSIVNCHTVFQLDAGNQHVLYTSYPAAIESATVKVEPKPSVWEKLSIAKHGLKRRK